MSDIPENAPPISAPPSLPTITAPSLAPVPRPAWGEEDTPVDTVPQTPTGADTEAALMFRVRQA